MRVPLYNLPGFAAIALPSTNNSLLAQKCDVNPPGPLANLTSNLCTAVVSPNRAELLSLLVCPGQYIFVSYSLCSRS